MSLAKDTIALVVPKTYDYAETIEDTLLKLGASVYCHQEWTEGVVVGLLKRLGLYRWLNEWRWQRFIRSLEQTQVDVLLVVRGSTLTPTLINRFSEHHQETHRVMYQWDSVQNHDYLLIAPYFNRVITFDRADSETHGFEYKPLFFASDLTEFQSDSIEKDLVFVSAYTQERQTFLQKLIEQCVISRIRLSYFQFQPLVARIKSILKREKVDASSKRMRRHDVYRMMATSKAVIDFHHDRQTGLTMRTIETLAMGKKLVTTNPSIQSEVFYRPEQVCVIDKTMPIFDVDWLNETYDAVDMTGQRLDRWLVDLLSR